eukprot:953734-Pyramimonas_sp.AAC.1
MIFDMPFDSRLILSFTYYTGVRCACKTMHKAMRGFSNTQKVVYNPLTPKAPRRFSSTLKTRIFVVLPWCVNSGVNRVITKTFGRL